MRRVAFDIITTFTIVTAIFASAIMAWPKDDGRYANSPLKDWFNGLSSSKGNSCSMADGQRLENIDWDTAAIAGAGGDSTVRYRVRIDGQWIVVPPEAVVTEPNRAGVPIVWPYKDAVGATQIRCFLAGSGT